MTSNLCKHCHLAMHEQVVKGKDELTNALQHFDAGAEEEVTHGCILIVELFLVRQLLYLLWHELDKEDLKPIDLNLLY